MIKLTNAGEKSYKQAISCGLSNYYDEFNGWYIIPMILFNNDTQLREKVLSLLTNGKCFNKDGTVNKDYKLSMEVIPHIDEDGNVLETVYDISIREIECYS